MRTLLAIVIFAGGIFALNAPADAARKSKRSAKPPQPKVDLACEARARHEDPSGDFARYPCWAREAFARGRNIDNR
jgi:hypothetical protein